MLFASIVVVSHIPEENCWQRLWNGKGIWEPPHALLRLQIATVVTEPRLADSTFNGFAFCWHSWLMNVTARQSQGLISLTPGHRHMGRTHVALDSNSRINTIYDIKNKNGNPKQSHKQSRPKLQQIYKFTHGLTTSKWRKLRRNPPRTFTGLSRLFSRNSTQGPIIKTLRIPQARICKPATK